jgi:putative oxidoreductase
MSMRRTSAVFKQWAPIPRRIIIGYGFIVHGWAKWSRGPEGFGKLLQQIGVPFPNATVWVVTLLELFGGVAILAGAFVALASIPLFTVHLKYGFRSINTIGLTKTGLVFSPPGYEVALLYIGGLFGMVLVERVLYLSTVILPAEEKPSKNTC